MDSKITRLPVSLVAHGCNRPDQIGECRHECALAGTVALADRFRFGGCALVNRHSLVESASFAG